MDEIRVRKVHRLVGVVVTPLVLLQAVSGLFLTVGPLGRFQRRVLAWLIEHDLRVAADTWDYLFYDVHFGPGAFGVIQHAAAALGLLLLATTGAVIFIKIQARSWARRDQEPGTTAGLHSTAERVAGKRRRALVLMVMAAVGLTALTTQVIYRAYRLSAMHLPLLAATYDLRSSAEETRFELTAAVAGDRPPDQAWASLEHAVDITERLLHSPGRGEHRSLGAGLQDLQGRLSKVRAGLDRLRELTVQRYVEDLNSGPVRQAYDRQWDEIMSLAGEIITAILAATESERGRFLYSNILLVSLGFVLTLGLGATFYRYELDRANHLAAAEAARDDAEESREFFRQTLQQTADPFVLFTPDGVIEDANTAAQQLVGRDHKGLKQSTLADLLAEDTAAALLESWARLSPGAPASYASALNGAGGNVLRVIANVAVVEWKQRRLILYQARQVSATSPPGEPA